MRRHSHVLAFLLAGALPASVPGCGDSTAPLKDGLDPLGTHLAVRASETVCCGGPDSRPEVLLTVATERIYERPIPALEADFDVTGQTIQVTIHGLRARETFTTQAPMPPYPPSGPAFFSRVLQVPEGEYRLVLTYTTYRDEYALSIQDDRLDLAPVTLTLSEPVSTRFWRVPDHSFVFHCDPFPGSPAPCDAVLDALGAEFGLEEFTYPPDGDNLLDHLDFPYFSAPARTFLYSDDVDFDQIREYWNGTLYPSLYESLGLIWIYDWRGDAIYLGPSTG